MSYKDFNIGTLLEFRAGLIPGIWEVYRRTTTHYELTADLYSSEALEYCIKNKIQS